MDHSEDGDETNSNISPQHQLFDERCIRRLKASDDMKAHKLKKNGSASQMKDPIKDQLSSTNTSTATSIEGDIKSNPDSPHQMTKQAAKIRDLEKIMAKCKESLKTKNTQLTMLRNSLSNVDRFKDSLDDVKRELMELKSIHETWTLSIAESKLVMHQEIEEKNAVIGSLKRQLKDGADRTLQHKSTIQNLESRLVSISLAHQKERDGLIKELTNAKNSALRQMQKEHELQLERVKLDLEKSIEALKSDILSRDQQIVRNGRRLQELDERNQALVKELEASQKKCDEDRDKFSITESERQNFLDRIDELEKAVAQGETSHLRCSDLTEKNTMLEKRIRELEDQVKDLSDECTELKNDKLKISGRDDDTQCSKCLEIQRKLEMQADNRDQCAFELSTSDQQAADIPSSTEFEYLKNIVYQFLMGREPVTLARVISAIFKFDMSEIEQICKIQEAIHQVSS